MISHPDIPSSHGTLLVAFTLMLAGVLGLLWGTMLGGRPAKKEVQWGKQLARITWCLWAITGLCCAIGLAWVRQTGGTLSGPTCFVVELSHHDPPLCVSRHIGLLWLGGWLGMLCQGTGLRLWIGFRLAEPATFSRLATWTIGLAQVALLSAIGWVYRPGGVGFAVDQAVPWPAGLYGAGLPLWGLPVLLLFGVIGCWLVRRTSNRMDDQKPA